jgi:serine/threonine-protein kinase
MSGALSLQPGGLFAGRFRVLRVLGHGGMGTVYEAQHVGTGAARALKVMLPQFAEDARFLRRFSQEARISALVDSEHVVQVLDVGVDEPTRTPFLVMELLRGESLAGYVLRRRCLQPVEVRAIFTQLFHALCAAHEAGVVHRDLKPENIFLARTRREGAPFTVKILDFGIAKILAEAQATATVRLGSPLWVAPEQTEARHKIGPSADLWAIGLLAFFCLTGRSYWLRASDEQFSIPALMRELLFDPLAPASERAAALQAGGLLPPGFDAWFARCVHRDPQARFSTAEARDQLLALLPQDNASIDPLPELTGAFARAQFPEDFLASAKAPPAPPPSHASATTQPPAAPPSRPTPTFSAETLHEIERMRPRRRWLPFAALSILGATGALLWSLWEPNSQAAHEPLREPAPQPVTSVASLPSALPSSAPTPLLLASAEPAASARSKPPATTAPVPAQNRSVLTSEGQGHLTVVCKPSCDSILIRGRNLGPSPLLRSPLAPGSYTARLARHGFSPRSVSFTVQPNQITVVRVDLDSKPPSSCSPPYTLDSTGNRRLKPECREL